MISMLRTIKPVLKCQLSAIHGGIPLTTILEKAKVASENLKELNQDEIDLIVENVSLQVKKNSLTIAKMVQEESQLGFLEDKYLKIESVVEMICNYFRDKKTVGLIEEDLETGKKVFAQPVGVCLGVTSSTGAGAAEYYKGVAALKTRNSLIIAPHPATEKSAQYVCKLIHDEAVKHGAPENCIQCVDQGSITKTKELMNSQDVDLIWCTGGQGVLDAATSTGKPTIGGAAGNCPVLIDDSVDFQRVAEDILKSKCFEYGTSCTGESNLFVFESIKEEMTKALIQNGCMFIPKDSQNKEKLINFMFNDGCINKDIVGTSAQEIIKLAGLNDTTGYEKSIVVEMSNEEIGKDYPLSGEKLSVVLCLYSVKDIQEAIELPLKSIELMGGIGHSAAIHSNNQELISAYASTLPVIRVTHNSPNTMGAVFDTYNKRIPTYSLGTGVGSGVSCSTNIGIDDLIKKVEFFERKGEDLWFIIPEIILKANEAKDHLKNVKGKRILVVIDNDPNFQEMAKPKLLEWLDCDNNVIEFCDDVEPDPSFAIIEKGAKKARDFNPEIILAIGGGSALDCGKGIKVLFENPEINLADYGTPFNDVFEQVKQIPELKKSEFWAIPTTTGSGSEISPAAVFIDKKNNTKHVIVDYGLTPNVALLIPDFLQDIPKSLLIDATYDALTHAIESYVSIMDCKEADEFALSAIKQIIDNLPIAVNENTMESKANLLYASADAAKSLSNKFVGITHSLAHQLGAQYHVPHGRANASYLVPVMEFNAAPAYEHERFLPAYNNKIKFDAKERYCKIGRSCFGLEGEDDIVFQQLIQKMKEFLKETEIQGLIDQTLQEIPKIEEEKLQEIAENALCDVCTRLNPRLPSLNELKSIFISIFNN